VKKVDFAADSAKLCSNRVILVTNLAVMEHDRKERKWALRRFMKV